MTGKGAYVSISIRSIALATDGSKLAVIEGTITRSDEPLVRALGDKK